jgi:predicted secreted protein
MGNGVRAFLILGSIVSILFNTAVYPETGAEKKSHDKITKDAVWNPDRQVVLVTKQKCSEFGGRQLEECFADSMESIGASPEAASFTRQFGNGTYIRRFRETGKRDIAYVAHPFRTSEQIGILLVNGEPPIVDVDDITLLPKESMEQDKTYGSIKKLYPRATLWPGDRTSKYPTIEQLPDGGQSFAVPYILRNLCHACEMLGTVYFAFDFDKDGRLVQQRFLRVEPMPKKLASKTESRKDTEQIRFIVMTEENKEFTVRLLSNRTTGYLWKPADPIDERIVKIVRSEYIPFERPGAVGVGGEDVFTFLGVGRGDAEIAMEYIRPWEKNQPAVKTATIKVTVRPASLKQ